MKNSFIQIIFKKDNSLYSRIFMLWLKITTRLA